ncbi:MAG TPA: WhiB family transcriptional regulator [Acidimicrobiales bacterium]|nr:WhiB family transcriptional regulator [Acidimicrobiales bacterium]
MCFHLESEKASSLRTGTSWMELARCRNVDPEVFFPRDGVGVQAAQRYCAECLVRESCLEYALENHIQHGVWGGVSERGRRRMAHRRLRATARPAEVPTTTPER